MLKFNNRVLNYNTRWLNEGSQPTPPTIYQIYTSGTNGSVAAVPSSGISGTEVTLSNTPNTGYQFSSYSVTGATLKNANQFDIGNSDVYVHGNFIESYDPYNPLNLPSNTVRVRTEDGWEPWSESATYETATLVDGTTDVYDVYKSGTDFNNLLYDSSNIIEVLGANTTGITSMRWMFYNCHLLTNVEIFDTSHVTNMQGMFEGCAALTTVPLFNTSSVIQMYRTFWGCTNVESGALALYQQASTQTNPPPYHDETFRYCGRDTTTGAAELAQIPSDWK